MDLELICLDSEDENQLRSTITQQQEVVGGAVYREATEGISQMNCTFLRSGQARSKPQEVGPGKGSHW